tara:strand:+ start:21960 stop:22622 length:663 start_codon:yes stop_codon:yes gene_type:complete
MDNSENIYEYLKDRVNPNSKIKQNRIENTGLAVLVELGKKIKNISRNINMHISLIVTRKDLESPIKLNIVTLFFEGRMAKINRDDLDMSEEEQETMLNECISEIECLVDLLDAKKDYLVSDIQNKYLFNKNKDLDTLGLNSFNLFLEMKPNESTLGLISAVMRYNLIKNLNLSPDTDIPLLKDKEKLLSLCFVSLKDLVEIFKDIPVNEWVDVFKLNYGN